MSLTLRCVVQAFRQDCTTLIERFENLETVRFEGFSEIWRDMKFSLVFCGRSSYSELFEFCEDALLVARDFFLPPHSFKARIGGLYLMYGLYFKMPIDGPKIRTKLQDWQEIIEIRAEIDQAEHHDASYILAKLMAANAFIHCPLDSEKGLERSYRVTESNHRNVFSVLSDLRDLAGPEELLHRLHKYSKSYGLCKASLTNAPGKSDDVPGDLHQYDSEFGKKLLEGVAWLEGSRKSTIFEKSSADDDARDNRRRRVKKHSKTDEVRNQYDLDYETDSSASETEETCRQSARDELPGFTSDDMSMSD